ncbi:FAD-dependent oxidoreductase [bacterium]|nr:MAG: FAD-dependent oxidoreductase [bacterium]
MRGDGSLVPTAPQPQPGPESRHLPRIRSKKDNNVDRYDLIVIGAGMGGVSAAFSAAEQGMHVALVERDKIGGT